MAVVQAAYIHGVPTRAVDDLVRAMGLTGTSKSQVSRLCEGEPSRRLPVIAPLVRATTGDRSRPMANDERVQAFLNRPPRGVEPHEVGPPGRSPDRPGDGRRGRRPFLWLDATRVKLREGGRAAIVARTNGATMACSRWR